MQHSTQLKSYFFTSLFLEEAQEQYDENVIDNFYKLLTKYGEREANAKAIKIADDIFQSQVTDAQNFIAAFKETEQQLANLYRKDICTALLKKFLEFETFADALDFIEQFNTKYADFKFYSYDDYAISKLAEETVERCKELTAITHAAHASFECAISRMHELALSLNVTKATDQDGNLELIFNQYMDAAWWRPRLRKVIRAKREELAFDCDLINPNYTKHSSKFGQVERKQQLERNQKWAEKTKISSSDESFLMSVLVKSKEACYQAELITMLTGLKNMQDKMLWCAAMITITCPSKMHKYKYNKKTKKFHKNKNFNGTTPKESADHLRYVWSKIRAQAKREGLDIRGMQVWQPHADACAHQHIYCIGSQEELSRFGEICEKYALEIDGDEKGAQARRCDIRYEDKNKGRLSSYAARYVTRLAAKTDDKKSNATATMTSEDSWYAAHSIRRISFFGLPPKSLYRAFRKATRKQCNSKQLKEIRKHARGIKDKNGKTILRADYAKFCEAIGWTGKRKDLNFETLLEECENKYGQIKKRITGIRFNSLELLKSTVKWYFEKAKKTLSTVIHNYPRAGKPASLLAVSAKISAEIDALFKNIKQRDLIPI